MNESTDLAVMSDEQALAALAALDLTPPGFEHVTQDDVPRHARLRVAQKRMLDPEVDAGTLYNDVSGAQYGKTVEIVFLAWKSDTRVMWPVNYDRNNDPLCASDNAITPSQSTSQRPLKGVQKGPCAQCPSAQFGKNGEAPRCKRQRNCVVYLVDDCEPVQLTIQSAGMTPGKRLTELSDSCNVRHTIWISAKYEDNKKGQYYVLVYAKSGKEGTRITPQHSLQLHALAEQVSKLATLADTARDGNGYTPDSDAQVIEHEPEQPPADEDEIPF